MKIIYMKGRNVMNIYTLNLGELGTNCYIVETAPDKCIAIDIGGNPEVFLDFIKSKNLTLDKILLTHGHFDHTEGVKKVQEETGASVYIHSGDATMLEGGSSSLASFFGRPSQKTENYTEIHDGDIIESGDIKFTVMHTPGHTKGSVCYIADDVIFSGDTLFMGSMGRTDYPGGDIDEMRESLKKLKNLSGDYKVYPGHFDSTTLDWERDSNPYMRGL